MPSVTVPEVDGYGEVWERFKRERRLEFGGHTDPNWRNGYSLSASFMVPVNTTKLGGRLAPLRDALRPFPFVSLHPDHFMHVTLLLLGFLVPEPHSEKEISRERIEELAGEAREVLRDFPAFSVQFANLNAFPGAAFVEVHDRGKLEELRGEVCACCGLEEPSGPPHLTLAYLQAPGGSPAPEDFVATIERYRDWPVGEISVDRIDLTLLDLGSEYPEPEVLAEIRLKGN